MSIINLSPGFKPTPRTQPQPRAAFPFQPSGQRLPLHTIRQGLGGVLVFISRYAEAFITVVPAALSPFLE